MLSVLFAYILFIEQLMNMLAEDDEIDELCVQFQNMEIDDYEPMEIDDFEPMDLD